MNKATKICLSILICTLVIAIFVAFYFIVFKTNDKLDLDLKTNHIILEVGETKDLKECYTVNNKSNVSILCFVSDLTYAEINEDNILTAKSKGETRILFKCGNSVDFEEKYINLTIVDKPIIPTDFNFDKSEVTLSLETEFIVNEINCLENYNVTPIISYSVNNICEYDVVTGKVLPISLGSTTVTVTFATDEHTISKSFVVNVKNNYRNFVINLTKENDYYILSLENNKISNFKVEVFENNILLTNVKVKFEFLENNTGASILQYESNIVMIRANSVGQSLLKIYCEDDPSVYKLIHIEVV